MSDSECSDSPPDPIFRFTARLAEILLLEATVRFAGTSASGSESLSGAGAGAGAAGTRLFRAGLLDWATTSALSAATS